MQKEINAIPKALNESEDPIKDIRTTAMSILKIAIYDYNDYLLKSAFDMAYGIVKFANDLEDPPKD